MMSKSDLGGILVRVRHSNFISSKQVNKSSGRELSMGNLLATLKYLKPSQKSETRQDGEYF